MKCSCSSLSGSGFFYSSISLNLPGVVSIGRRCQASWGDVSTRGKGRYLIAKHKQYQYAMVLPLIDPVWMQAETTWALTVLGYLAKFVLGILG